MLIDRHVAWAADQIASHNHRIKRRKQVNNRFDSQIPTQKNTKKITNFVNKISSFVIRKSSRTSNFKSRGEAKEKSKIWVHWGRKRTGRARWSWVIRFINQGWRHGRVGHGWFGDGWFFRRWFLIFVNFSSMILSFFSYQSIKLIYLVLKV